MKFIKATLILISFLLQQSSILSDRSLMSSMESYSIKSDEYNLGKYDYKYAIDFYIEDWHKLDTVYRANFVYDVICKTGGWWGEGCPKEKDIVSILLYEEGSTLYYVDKINMAKGMRYRFHRFAVNDADFIKQLSGFTAFYNANWDSILDNRDIYAIIEPSRDIKEYIDIVNYVYSKDLDHSDGMYLYWFSENEIIEDRSKWDGKVSVDYVQALTQDGKSFYFTGIPNILHCAIRSVGCK